MDSGMIGQFAPVILQYLGQQGVGGSAAAKPRRHLGYWRHR
jgi:hypothetical protein